MLKIFIPSRKYQANLTGKLSFNLIFFLREKLLSSEKSLRQQLEAELAEKTEQLYKERVIPGENGRYSPSMNLTSSTLGNDTSFREELSVAQRLNLQVISQFSNHVL